MRWVSLTIARRNSLVLLAWREINVSGIDLNIGNAKSRWQHWIWTPLEQFLDNYHHFILRYFARVSPKISVWIGKSVMLHPCESAILRLRYLDNREKEKKHCTSGLEPTTPWSCDMKCYNLFPFSKRKCSRFQRHWKMNNTENKQVYWKAIRVSPDLSVH